MELYRNPITHGIQARAVIQGYVRTGVSLAKVRGDDVDGIPYGKRMLSHVLGREPTAFELSFAAEETLRELRGGWT